MEDGFKIGKYTIYNSISTGRVFKVIDGDFDDDDFTDESNENESQTDSADGYWKPDSIPCPIGLDDLETVKESTKPTDNIKLSYKLDIDFPLMAVPHLHEHNIWVDPQETDPEYIEFDVGSLDCQIPIKLGRQVEVKPLNKEQTKTEYAEKIKELIEKNPNQFNKEELSSSQVNFNQMREYVELHFDNELIKLVDRLVFEYFTLLERGKQREENINIILDNEEKELRKRLATPKGRVPITQRNNYEAEKKDFIAHCFRLFKVLENKKKNLNKTRLAEIAFADDSNPLQSLRRKLKTFNLSFEEVLQMYTEQKSS